jgi:DNA repair exonuclease SbcCD ATPase subunit
MKILSLEWRNIGSFGDKIQRIDFHNEGALWQLYGRSGFGKSTILSLPTLAFYGKMPKVKLANIANRINKNGWIKCEVVSGTNTYVIERTFSPSSLTLKRNDEIIDKANSRDLEYIIENEIVCMPYQIFSNVISLSLNNFKSFIDMTPNDKRQIIDKIFCLDAMNKIIELIKKDEKELANSISALDKQIYSIEQSIKTSENELENLKNNTTENIDFDLEISKYNEMIKDVDNKMLELTTTKSAFDNELAKYQQERNVNYQTYVQYNNELNNIKKQIDLYNQGKCPICATEFVGDAYESLRKTLNENYEKVETYVNQLKNNLQIYDEHLKKLNNGITTINQNYTNYKILRNNYLAAINGLNIKKNTPNQYDAIENIIIKTKENKNNLLKENDIQKRKMDNIQYLENLYAQNGEVKQQIMNNYIPSLNEDIRSMLTSFSFPYMLEFDNNFNPHLYDMGDEIEVTTLSTGEQKRVDLAVLCAIIKLIKTRFSQINMICLDETVSSIDPQTAEEIISILMDIAHTIGLNIFVVSHVTLPENYFDEKIEVIKNSSFSDLIIG